MPDPIGAGQIPLDLPYEEALGRDDFLIGASNRAAFELIDRWPDWPSDVVLLAGPVGAGKTHLVEIWRELSGAGKVPAADLHLTDPSALAAQGAVAVEDAHAGFDEKAMFHLLNACRQSGAQVLVTSRTWPQSWKLTVPDLASRLRAATPVEIEEPDDDLLRRLLVKLFADRQIMVDPAVIDFLVVRMERSLAVAGQLVNLLDRMSLADRRKITRPLAGRCLEMLSSSAE